MYPISNLIEFKKSAYDKDLMCFITSILVSEGFDDKVYINETNDRIQLFINKINLNLVITDRIVQRLKQHKSAI
jgi:hypothetical protein